MALLAILLATVPAVPRPRTQVIRVAPPPPSNPAWTSWEGEALLVEPIELSLSDEIRARCAGYPLPPEGAAIDARVEATSSSLSELGGLARCLKSGPLAGHELDLFGATDLPGRHTAPVEGAGGADVVRTLLGRLAVPFSSLVTQDLEMDPTVSAHGAARVVVAVHREESEP